MRLRESRTRDGATGPDALGGRRKPTVKHVGDRDLAASEAPELEPVAVATAGPRIYNLFPRLIGSIDDWAAHLPRIAAMNFNWVYVNSFHEPGASGSLYAVKDPYRLNPLFR